MNTDMNQYLIFRYASTVVRKMTAYQLCCAGLARSPFVLTEHISSDKLILYTFKTFKKICVYGLKAVTYIELSQNALGYIIVFMV